MFGLFGKKKATSANWGGEPWTPKVSTHCGNGNCEPMTPPPVASVSAPAPSPTFREPAPAPKPRRSDYILEPRNGRVAVEREEAEYRSAGGIYIPDQAQEKNCRVRVMATCPDWIEDGIQRTTSFEPGEILLVSRYAGEEFVLDRGRMKVVLVLERDVLARINVPPDAFSLPDVRTVPKDLPAITLDGDGIEKPAAFDRLPA